MRPSRGSGRLIGVDQVERVQLADGLAAAAEHGQHHLVTAFSRCGEGGSERDEQGRLHAPRR